MKPKFFWRLLIAILFINVHSYGQDANPILSMEVVATSVGNNFSPDSLPIVTDSTIYQISVNLNLYDSTDIKNIEVNIGSTQGGTEFISHNFAFDVSGSLGNGISYSRNGYNIQLELGELVGVNSFFANVRVQRLDNSYSPYIAFNR